jgi:regulator of protease activity HflC (stomatin/prohibitin superfamily)
MVEPVLVTVSIILLFVVLLIGVSGIRIIQPYEQGLLIVLGRFRRRLNPGFNMVVPLVSQVVRLDLRTQVLDVPRQEVITRDNSPTQVDAVIYLRIIDPDKAYFQVANFRLATVALAQTTLRSVIGDMELDEVLYNRAGINGRLRDILDEATDNWGVRIEAVEIREVDPVGPVKAAMEEQTSAERQRRAAILRADGEKRSKILVAEGDKRSRILQAEGVRQAQVVEAEGQRLAKILTAQGEAQSLRILSLGAATLDQKAIAIRSLDALEALGRGPATKIILPFEITRVVQGAAKYFGAAVEGKEAKPSDLKELERLIGTSENVLGTIPSPKELRDELVAIERELQKEAAATEEIAHRAEKKAPSLPTGDDEPAPRTAIKKPKPKPE